MLVYGDPQYEQEWGALAGHLRARLEAALRSADLDALRALLAAAGQFEQGTQDAAGPPISACHAQGVTDAAARAFCAGWRGESPRTALRATADALARLPRHGPPLRVKVPEGFAFYALYPERYVVAAQRWLAAHGERTPRRALVVGVRSIGTALSAVVMAALEAGGWQARRLTVRPEGQACERRAEIAPGEVAGTARALIVDEGPGQSGASMAAVAEALTRAGLDPARVAFLPGHDGGPGAQAAEPVRALWAATPCWVCPLLDLRWGDRTLPEELAARTAALLGRPGAGAQVDDQGGGLWRRFVYRGPSAWPAAGATFERTKYRVTLAGGEAVLWKFAGLALTGPGGETGAEAALGRLQRRPGWGPEPLGTALGFVATRWVSGTPLTRADGRDPAVLGHVGRYIASVAEPPERDKREAARARLREMLYWNTWEALGEEAAAKAAAWADVVRADDFLPSAGDGHLAPHEWVRTPHGRLVKTDGSGHDADHTVIGPQPVAWDLAGALVEWGLTGNDAELLMASFRAAGGPDITPALLRFHRLAYAAFRVGQTSVCAHLSAHDPDEQARQWAAHAGYRAELARLLGPGPSGPAN